MRAVERRPWAERRSAAHDELCELVAAHPGVILSLWGEKAARLVPSRVVVEAPCGPGFCDVLIECEAAARQRRLGLIVEVKTDDESASAGDIIRQLKFYGERLRETRRYNSIWLAVVVESLTDTTFKLIDREAIGIVMADQLHDAARERKAVG